MNIKKKTIVIMKIQEMLQQCQEESEYEVGISRKGLNTGLSRSLHQYLLFWSHPYSFKLAKLYTTINSH